MKKITVIGSANVDYVVKLQKLPGKGETVTDGRFFTSLGGKGANQAVAARLMDAEVNFIACVGKDHDGDEIIKFLKEKEINIEHLLQTDKTHTGKAFIFVDDNGDNMISVVPGANRELTPEIVKHAEETISKSDVVLSQLEIPVDTILESFSIATSKGVKTILNPAPARKLPHELFEMSTFITPNRLEAEFYTGVHITDKSSAERAAMEFAKMGVQNVIITLGEKGCFYFSYEKSENIRGFEVESIDTTGAGDAFNGVLAVCLAEGMEALEAIQWANAAGALATTSEGAIPSLPDRKSIEQFLVSSHQG